MSTIRLDFITVIENLSAYRFQKDSGFETFISIKGMNWLTKELFKNSLEIRNSITEESFIITKPFHFNSFYILEWNT